MQPCNNMALELLVLDPASDWFVLSVSQLDDENILDSGDKVLTPDPLPFIYDGDSFETDVSLLDNTTDLLEGIGAAPAGYVWMDVTSTTTFIDINRGMDTTRSVVARPYAGTLEAKVIDPYLDALTNRYVGLNTRCRLRVGNDVVFLGSVYNLRTEYDAVGVPTLHLKAADVIARLNSITVAARPSETFQSRIAGIATAADTVAIIGDAGGETLTATDDETNALELLYSTLDSEGGVVWIDRWNQIHSVSRGQLSNYTDVTTTRINSVPDPDCTVRSSTNSAFWNYNATRNTCTVETTGGPGIGGNTYFKTLQTGATYSAYISHYNGYMTLPDGGGWFKLSLYAKAEGAGFTPDLIYYMDVYTAANAYLEFIEVKLATALTSTWTRYETLVYLSATAKKVQGGLQAGLGATGQGFSMDNVLFEKTTELDTPYFDGDSSFSSWSGTANNSSSTYSFTESVPIVELTTTEQRMNLYSSPVPTLSTDYYNGRSTMTIDATTGAVNTSSVKLVAAGTGNVYFGLDYPYAPVEPNTTYVISGYYKTSGTAQVGPVFWLGVNNGLGSHIATLNSPSIYGYSEEWVRMEYIYTTPAGAASMEVEAEVYSGAGAAALESGWTAWFDGFHVEKLSTYNGYFDGNTAGAFWGGPANDAVSVLNVTTPNYPNSPLFSNDHNVGSNHICMSAFATGMDTDSVINQITFNNLEWNGTAFVTKDYTYSDATSTGYYGVRKQILRVALNPATLSAYADEIFLDWANAERKVKSVAFPLDDFSSIDIRPITYLDIGDPVKVYLNDPDNTNLSELTGYMRVASISHRITPTLWETQIGLL